MVFRLLCSKRGEGNIPLQRILSGILAFLLAMTLVLLTSFYALSDLKEGTSFERSVMARDIATQVDALSSMPANILLDTETYPNGYSFEFEPNSVAVIDPNDKSIKTQQIVYPFMQDLNIVYQLGYFEPFSITTGKESKYTATNIKMGKTGDYFFATNAYTPVDEEAFSCPPASTSLNTKSLLIKQISNRAALAQPDIKNLLKNAEIAIFTYPEELQEGSIVAYIPKTALDERVRFACLFLNRASANFQKNGLSLEGRAIVPFDFDIQATQILMVIAIDKSTYESSRQSVLDAVTEAINLYG